MNGLEILKYITKKDTLLSKFGGLYAKDQLTFSLPKRDIFFICNTEIAREKGKHWVVIYLPKNGEVIEYFDSLGNKPEKEFIHFMSQTKRYILFNIKRVQGESSKACGYYCIYFASLRDHGIDYTSIINNFSDSYDINEKHVSEFIKHSIK